jgi:hypothetical protein
MQIAAVILVLLVVGAILGSALNFAGVFLGIPLVLIFLGAVIGKETLERQRRILRMKRFQREARARKLEFSEEDKRTMIS